MSLADVKMEVGGIAPSSAPVSVNGHHKPLHHIKEVRQQQGVSLRSAARRMEMEVSELRALEDEDADMMLSTLYRWQEALEVPVTNLLVNEDDALSDPIQKRARLLRIMKTAMAIREKAESKPLDRLSSMLVEQLVELMPELQEVSAWPTVGQRRSLDECGRIVERTVPDDWMFTAGN